MTNLFLKINKDLFALDLEPIQILIVAQVMEFQANKCDCFISNEQLAKNFGVSENTIKRALNKLEEKNFITRSRNKDGKRFMVFNQSTYEQALLALRKGQNDPCDNKGQNGRLPGAKLAPTEGQNDPIKDKRKDKLKDNNSDCPLGNHAEKGQEEGSSIDNPIEKKLEEFTDEEKRSYQQTGLKGVIKIDKKYYKIIM